MTARDHTPAPARKQRPASVQRAARTVFIAALIAGWLALAVWNGFADLGDHGVDRTLAGTLVVALAAATAALYLLAGVLLLKGDGRSRPVLIWLAVPAASCAIYTFVLGATNTDRVGFGAGSLMFLGVGVTALSASVARTAATDPGIRSWLRSSRSGDPRA